MEEYINSITSEKPNISQVIRNYFQWKLSICLTLSTSQKSQLVNNRKTIENNIKVTNAADTKTNTDSNRDDSPNQEIQNENKDNSNSIEENNNSLSEDQKIIIPNEKKKNENKSNKIKPQQLQQQIVNNNDTIILQQIDFILTFSTYQKKLQLITQTLLKYLNNVSTFMLSPVEYENKHPQRENQTGLERIEEIGNYKQMYNLISIITKKQRKFCRTDDSDSNNSNNNNIKLTKLLGKSFLNCVYKQVKQNMLLTFEDNDNTNGIDKYQ